MLKITFDVHDGPIIFSTCVCAKMYKIASAVNDGPISVPLIL